MVMAGEIGVDLNIVVAMVGLYVDGVCLWGWILSVVMVCVYGDELCLWLWRVALVMVCDYCDEVCF